MSTYLGVSSRGSPSLRARVPRSGASPQQVDPLVWLVLPRSEGGRSSPTSVVLRSSPCGMQPNPVGRHQMPALTFFVGASVGGSTTLRRRSVRTLAVSFA